MRNPIQVKRNLWRRKNEAKGSRVLLAYLDSSSADDEFCTFVIGHAQIINLPAPARRGEDFRLNQLLESVGLNPGARRMACQP